MEGRMTFLSEGEAPFAVWAEIRAVGPDIHIIIGGGEVPHIGSVALAEPSAARHPVTGEPVCRPPDGRRDATVPASDARPGVEDSAVPADGAGPGVGDSAVLADGARQDGDIPADGARLAAGSCHLSALSAAGHKDAALAEMFARAFCGAFAANVCAAAGVHVNHASDEMIKRLMGNAGALLERSLTAWASVGKPSG
jgi:hypothetical protein